MNEFAPKYVVSEDVEREIRLSGVKGKRTLVEEGTLVEIVRDEEVLRDDYGIRTPPGMLRVPYDAGGYFVTRFVPALVVVRLQ